MTAAIALGKVRLSCALDLNITFGSALGHRARLDFIALALCSGFYIKPRLSASLLFCSCLLSLFALGF